MIQFSPHITAINTPVSTSRAVQKNGSRPTGFSLLELLVTLAIMAVLATLTVPIAQLIRQRASEQELRDNLREIRQGIDAYHNASNEGRIARAIGDSGYPTTLRVLVDGVPDQRDPRKHMLFFLRRIPRDPMTTNNDEAGSASSSTTVSPDSAAINQAAEDSWRKRSYASPADAPEEGEDVYDVTSSSHRIGLNGIPYTMW